MHKVLDRVNMFMIEKLTTARSSESANAFEDDTSKKKPTAAAVRTKGSSISLVGLGCRLYERDQHKMYNVGIVQLANIFFFLRN